MKAFGKLMRMWTVALSFVLCSIVFGWAPVIDLIHDMGARQAGVWAIIGALFIACVLMCWTEHKKRKASNVDMLAKQAIVDPQMLLMYPSIMGEITLRIPVTDIWHAQDLVKTLMLKEARVGYFNKTIGEETVLYVTDSNSHLVLP